MQAEQEAKKVSTAIRLVEFLLILIGSGLATGITWYYHHHVNPAFPYSQPIYLLILLIGGVLGIRVFTGLVFRIAQPTIGITRGRGVRNFILIIGAILIVITAFGILGYLPSLTSALLAGGFIAIVLGLAAQQVLGNIFGGVSLLFTKPFEIGDRITMVNSSYGLLGPTYPHESLYPGYTGIVADVGIFYTTLLLDEGVPTVVPNSQMINALILNHSKVSIRTIRVRMDVDRRISFQQFKSQLQAAVKSETDETGIHAPKLEIEVIDTGIGTYQVLVKVWARAEVEEPVKSRLLQQALAVIKNLTPPS
jgi:small-conductance mechanosensitive channel